MLSMKIHGDRPIKKCIKYNLPKQNVLISYHGNLTAAKWARISSHFQRYIRDEYKGYVESREKFTVENAYTILRLQGDKEKNVTISQNDNGTFNIVGEGWHCSNHPADDWTVIYT